MHFLYIFVFKVSRIDMNCIWRCSSELFV